jgi:hypothetical protein
VAYNGSVSTPITRGLNFTLADIKAAIDAVVGAPVTVAAFGGAGALNDTGFQVTFNGAPLAGTNVAALELVGASGFVGETAKGGPIDNGGNQVEVTANHAPVVTVPAAVTIPVRTPFALTGSATDADGETLTYLWEQNDRGGISGGSAAGTTLVSNLKLSGPLFRQFGTAAIVSPEDTLKYYSPGENAVSTDPTRVFPDMAQILAGTTNAKTGTCPEAPPSPTPVPADVLDCYSEFLPTADWIGFTSDRVMHFRLTARDGHPGAGGVANAEMTLTLAPTAGPFLVTSQASPTTIEGGTPQTITWDVAGTDVAPVNATDVRISLSADGGATFPYVLATSTANDGTESVTIPNVATTKARIKIEAVGNVFFDLNDADLTIQGAPEVGNDAPGGTATVQYSDALSPTVTVTATDADSAGSALTATASGLPAGLSLAAGSTSDHSATWTVAGNTIAAPGSYPVSVAVSDELGITRTTAFTIVVSAEDAEATYTGDSLAFTSSGATAMVNLRATVRDSSVVPGSGDSAPGNIATAMVTFKEGSTTLCTATVGLIGSAATTGSANCSAALGVGTHTVTTVVGGYYTGSTTASVKVTKPEASLLTGAGFLKPTRSAGSYPADPGSKATFAFLVAGGKNVTGQVEVLYQSGNRVYEIRSTGLDSLGLASGPDRADLRGRASLVDVTNPFHPAAVATGLTVQLSMTDRGSRDSLGITVWNGNTLVFSSDWTGTRTQELNLAGGAVVILH